MKKAILILSLLVAPILSSNLMAQQITGMSNQGAILPKKVCEVAFGGGTVSITGNNSKTFTLVSKDGKFNNYTFTFNRTGGNAKTTLTVYYDGLQHDQWVFDRNISKGTKTLNLNNVAGKEVILKVKNNSATDRIKGNYTTSVNTNSMLAHGSYSFKSNETLTKKINSPYSVSLQTPCNGKGTIEINRLKGKSSAEIVVTQGNTVLKTMTIASNETSIRINFNTLNNSTEQLRLEIRNIQTNKFITVKIGAWFN